MIVSSFRSAFKFVNVIVSTVWPRGRDHRARVRCWRRAHVTAGLLPLADSRAPEHFRVASLTLPWLASANCGRAPAIAPRAHPAGVAKDGNGEFPVGERMPIPVPAGQKIPHPRPR